ncbi:MAG: glycosyltransferase [Microgenomates group bacterium]
MIKSPYPNFSIIIPHHNGREFLTTCLKSVNTAIKLVPYSKFEIIIIDNASTDNSLQNIKTKIIHNQKNFGFAKAVNQGILAAKYNYVCLLNNDLLLDKNWFKYIVKNILESPKFTTFCGTVLSKDGSKIESQGLRYFMSGRCENINNGKPFDCSLITDHSSLVWGSSAAAVIYKKADIVKVGLFDESFFAYIEDVDLSYRLNKNKYKALLIPSAICYHLGGGTSSKMGTLRQYYTLRNWLKLIVKNYSIFEIIRHFPSILIERLRNLSYLLKSLLKFN